MDIVASEIGIAAPEGAGVTVESHCPKVASPTKTVVGPRNRLADPLVFEKAVRFERDVAPFREPLYLRARNMCRHDADAEDLVQDTMVKAYSSFHTFAPDTNLKAWLFRILTNTYISGYRRKHRRPVQYSMEGITDQDLLDHAERTPSGLVSAEDQALAALPDSEIKAAVESLPEEFRAVVYYADVQGFRYREIAEIMGTPSGTVMSRLHRARKRLRRALVAGADHPPRRQPRSA